MREGRSAALDSPQQEKKSKWRQDRAKLLEAIRAGKMLSKVRTTDG